MYKGLTVNLIGIGSFFDIPQKSRISVGACIYTIKFTIIFDRITRKCYGVRYEINKFNLITNTIGRNRYRLTTPQCFSKIYAWYFIKCWFLCTLSYISRSYYYTNCLLYTSPSPRD